MQSLFERFRDSELLRNIALTRRDRTPSARLCLFFLMLGTFLLAIDEVFFMPTTIAAVVGLATSVFQAILVYAILIVPAFLAFVLLLLRRPAGLYGALAIFLWTSLAMVGLIQIVGGHLSFYRLVLMSLVALVSVWGVIVAFREAAGGKVVARILAFAAFLALQLGTAYTFFILATD